jgi:hypothetical protein
MHEHAPREAALLERTLKNGMHDPKILHSFQLGKTSNPRGTGPRDELPKSYAFAQDDPNLPDIEVFVHDHGKTIDYPSHYEPGTGIYHSSVYSVPDHTEIPIHAPEGTRLPSKYEAVH